uniref:DNA-directed RNA polymerase subunit n=1 Tax=Dermatophagoides pteronyssinus TaxID=6956 RepID=A0A6P6XKK8_DERPT|nr:DNA-directed RNA polymerase II subunit rpb1-like [Dermatophagoides pteronyssinus]
MSYRVCCGHFGHIELKKPVLNYAFIKTVVNVLRCVCVSCARILAHPSDKRFRDVLLIKSKPARLTAIANITRTVTTCPIYEDDNGNVIGCGASQPTFKRDNLEILADFSRSGGQEGKGGIKTSVEKYFSTTEILSVFKKIRTTDIKLLGFDGVNTSPENLIIRNLIVMPPCVRPPVQFGADRCEDDLTAKYNDILLLNKQIKRFEEAGAASHVMTSSYSLLQYHVATLMNNEISGIPVATTRRKKPIKGIRERLKGKNGRLRGNLMGKRVDFSARTVITGDPNLDLDQVGVPYSIAMNLTFPEIVINSNLDEMRMAVTNGPYKWPGAKYVIRKDGTRYDLRHCYNGSSDLQLEPGCVVERHLRDGDYVLFNRQPSLHKMSIMGHRVKVLPYSSFRINLSVTSPYNADFDGDEMNMHVPQSYETRAEIKYLCAVPYQTISPQSNKPVMGIVQDTLIGVTLMSDKNIFVTKKELMSLCLQVEGWSGEIFPPTVWKPQKLWTGKQLFTLCLLSNNNIRIRSENPNFTSNDGHVIIEDGELLSGVIDKKIVGATSGGLIHVLWHQCGVITTRNFIHILQRVVTAWMLTQGFTVGISDIIVADETAKKISEVLQARQEAVKELFKKACSGNFETQPGKGLLRSFEAVSNSEFNSAREIAGKYATDFLSNSNNIYRMVMSGSKGSMINISQIMACVGQQNVEGKRIPFGFNARTLPHFAKFDFNADSRGFVKNSYLSGLLPHELFFHAMGGREGIIDTACKTSETGYIQRRLVKAMEDVAVAYDGTVRNSNNEIIQFFYGEDGIRGEFIEQQDLILMTMNYEKLKKRFFHDIYDENYGKGWLEPSIAQEIISRVHTEILDREYQFLLDSQRMLQTEIFPDGEYKQYLPVKFERFINIAKKKFLQETICTVDPRDLVRQIDQLVDDLQPVRYADNIVLESVRCSMVLFVIQLRTYLNSLELLRYHKFSQEALTWIFDSIKNTYRTSLIQAGEVVGCLAAQSIGEPATQMTLNTFHFAGVGAKNVTLGIPRLRELLNVAINIATPSLTVYLDSETAKNSEFVRKLQGEIEFTTLEKFIKKIELVFDPEIMSSCIPEDNEWVEDYYSLNEMNESSASSMSVWVLRLTLQQRLITEGLRLSEIGEKIKKLLAHLQMSVIWTDDNSDQFIIRIRASKNSAKLLDLHSTLNTAEVGSEETIDLLTYLMETTLPSIRLRGIPGIKKVYIREERAVKYNPDKGVYEPCNGGWILDTDGVNLASVFTLEHVDFTRTISNNISEVLKILGIEAARAALLKEIRQVISFDGSYVNYRHLAILCDVMTHRGTLVPINRHGINRVNKGLFAKSSFEETVEIFSDAAMFGEMDTLNGLTENIIFGQLANFGTGMSDIMIDYAKLKNANTYFESYSGAEWAKLNNTVENNDISKLRFKLFGL